MPTRLIFFSLHSAINLGQSSGGAPNLVPSGEDEWLSSVNMRNTMRALGNNWWIFSISSRLSKVIISTPLSFAYLMWSIVLRVNLTCYNRVILRRTYQDPCTGWQRWYDQGSHRCSKLLQFPIYSRNRTHNLIELMHAQYWCRDWIWQLQINVSGTSTLSLEWLTIVRNGARQVLHP